jgi:tellurite resistance protein TehA-like permease
LITLFLLPVKLPRSCPGTCFNYLVISAIALVTLIGVLWIGQTATYHRDAADDLMHQLVSSMDTQLLASLQGSIKMVKEAHNTWSFTGLFLQMCNFRFS